MASVSPPTSISEPSSTIIPRTILDPRCSEKGRKRFWKEVHVRKIDKCLQIYLDSRPLRRSNNKILTIPVTKPNLATAIAVEWDCLVSTQQALKPHMIPLTSLASRALDIEDSEGISNEDSESIRSNIATSLLRYFDTDSLLCWAPPPPLDPPGYEKHKSRTEPLWILQQRAASPIVEFLQKKLWPGVKIDPILNGHSIIPKAQSPETREIIYNWIHGLSAWDLAGLERGVLAGKGLLGAVRLVVEWGENFRHLIDDDERHTRQSFGIEEAAKVFSLEVEWQTSMWGLVEDTHDVDREDLRRQLGSVVILVSGCRS